MIDGLKIAGKTLQEAGKIEQYQQILDAQQKMLEMQSQINELTNENKHLREELDTKASLVFEASAYWAINGDLKDGPFCSRCWDVEKNTVRLKPVAHNKSFSTCPECTGTFQTDPHYTRPTPFR